MNRRIKSLTGAFVVLVAAAVSVSGVSAAEFGARAFGMGGAYTGAEGDVSSIVYNPSRLTDTSFEVGVGLGASDVTALASFRNLLTDPSKLTDEESIDLVALSGISVGPFGAAFAVDGELEVKTDCPAGDMCARGSMLTQILLGAGRDSIGLPFNLAGVKIGAALKRLDARRIDFNRSDNGLTYETVTDSWNGQGYSLNLGASVGPSEMVTLGFSATDILSTITWQGARTDAEYDTASGAELSSTTTDLGTSTEKLTPVYRAGVSIKPPLMGAMLMADVASDGTFRYGVEKNFFVNALSLRAGQIRSAEQTTTTAGIGFNIGPVRLDAAAGSSDGFESMTTMIEGSVRF